MASLTQQLAGRENIELKAKEYDKLQQMIKDQALARYAAEAGRRATYDEIEKGLAMQRAYTPVASTMEDMDRAQAQYGQINKPDGLSGMGVE
jgi:predicted ATPase